MALVKVCGITNLADAKLAVAAGADALGFIFAKSPRRVTPRAAKAIIAKLPPSVSKVGVFVDESPETMRRVAAYCRLDAVQLHGNEKPSAAKALGGIAVIKAFRVGPGFTASAAKRWPADALLFDTRVSGKKGGTGKTFDWSLVKKNFGRPVILSGGLGPDNVASAVRNVRPWAVDASSVLEAKPGKKDPKAVKEFVRNAKKA